MSKEVTTSRMQKEHIPLE